MNGPLTMYKTRQIIRHDISVDIPNCMYKLKNIHSRNGRSPPRHHVLEGRNRWDISEQNYLKDPDMTELMNRQEEILRQLADLKNQMLEIKRNLHASKTEGIKAQQKTTSMHPVKLDIASNLIVNCNPSNPPFAILFILKLWSGTVNIKVKTYIHSSISTLTESAKKLSYDLENYELSNNVPTVLLRLIWKDVGPNAELIVRQTTIIGEANILRYFSRIAQNQLNYELSPKALEIDSVLDLSYCLIRSRTKTERNILLQSLNKRLGKSKWFCNCDSISIADLAVYSAIRQTCLNEINQNLSKWLQRCEEAMV